MAEREVEFDGGRIVVTERGMAICAPGGMLVRCLGTEGERWRAVLPRVSFSNYLEPFLAYAEVHGDALFVVWNNEHSNAGGSPYATSIHRVLPGGKVAWGLMVDGGGGWPKLSRDGDVLTVEAGWTDHPLAPRAMAPTCRRVDVSTGRLLP
ncbi:MAG: hypothetical protein QM765_11050 [Myxococcales bacterium]